MITANEANAITKIAIANFKLKETTKIMESLKKQEDKILDNANRGGTFAIIDIPETFWLSQEDRKTMTKTYFKSFGYSISKYYETEDSIKIMWGD